MSETNNEKISSLGPQPVDFGRKIVNFSLSKFLFNMKSLQNN